MICWVKIPKLQVNSTNWNTSGLKINPLLIYLTGTFSINCWYCCVSLFLMSTACYRATPAWTCWTSVCGTPGSTTYRSEAPPTGSSRSSATRTSPRVAGRSVAHRLSLLLKTFWHFFVVRLYETESLKTWIYCSSNKI